MYVQWSHHVGFKKSIVHVMLLAGIQSSIPFAHVQWSHHVGFKKSTVHVMLLAGIQSSIPFAHVQYNKNENFKVARCTADTQYSGAQTPKL